MLLEIYLTSLDFLDLLQLYRAGCQMEKICYHYFLKYV